MNCRRNRENSPIIDRKILTKMHIWMGLSAPVHSKTTSKPSLASNAARAATAASFDLLICSSEKVVAAAESLEIPLTDTPLDLGIVDATEGEGKQ